MKESSCSRTFAQKRGNRWIIAQRMRAERRPRPAQPLFGASAPKRKKVDDKGERAGEAEGGQRAEG
jgi:hypothetical protein